MSALFTNHLPVTPKPTLGPTPATPAATRRRLTIHRLDMDHPGDLSGLARLLETAVLSARDIVAVIGKTEGNGGVNDFTRGYFTQTLMALLALHTGRSVADLLNSVPCVLSGGTEGVLTPHYVVFARCGPSTATPAAVPAGGAGPAFSHDAGTRPSAKRSGALAIGTAVTDPLPAHHVGRWEHVASVAGGVRAAMRDAGITRVEDVAFVQVKSPCVTATRAQAAQAAGHNVLTADSNRSMAWARAAGAFGVGVALGELPDDPALSASMLNDFARFSVCASVSSGVEVNANEVIVLGHSADWDGPLRMVCATMDDALDIQAVTDTVRRLGLPIGKSEQSEQSRRSASSPDGQSGARLVAAFIKCEPDRHGRIRGARHTMLDDTDINAQRHIRGAVGGLVAGVLGDTRLFVSGGAEHQGPDGGGLIAVIAE